MADWSLLLVPRFASATVAWHDGGHHVPRKPFFSHLVADFVLQHRTRSTTPSPDKSPSMRSSPRLRVPPTVFPFITTPFKLVRMVSEAGVEELRAKKTREMTRSLWAEVRGLPTMQA
ncbi:hypothetical protein JCM11641_003480 [Rhodosporidiobolus odoratus]